MYSTGTAQSTTLYYPRRHHMQYIFFTPLSSVFIIFCQQSQKQNSHLLVQYLRTALLPPFTILLQYCIFRPSALPLHRLFALPIFCCHSSRALLWSLSLYYTSSSILLLSASFYLSVIKHCGPIIYFLLGPQLILLCCKLLLKKYKTLITFAFQLDFIKSWKKPE